jgi:DivIVA domain-containing protein
MSVAARVDERLTPDRVQSVSFPQARLGRRGLDEDHVRAFCAHVERELVTLLNEKAALWEEASRTRLPADLQRRVPQPSARLP